MMDQSKKDKATILYKAKVEKNVYGISNKTLFKLNKQKKPTYNNNEKEKRKQLGRSPEPIYQEGYTHTHALCETESPSRSHCGSNL